MPTNFNRNIILWIVISIFTLIVVNAMQSSTQQQNSTKLGFSDFLAGVEASKIKDVTIREGISGGSVIKGHLTGGEPFTTHAPHYPQLVEKLQTANVSINADVDDGSETWLGMLLSWFPLLLFIGVYIFFMRQMQGGGRSGGGAMGFGRARTKQMNERTDKVTFKDVAGIDEAKEELEEIVDFLKEPEKFQKLGGKIPRGCLLIGPPGTGKTLLARAIAGEAGVPFFTISGSDFVEMFVGVGASRVRDMFDQGKRHSPCIIFIDEIDAVGRHRGAGHGGGNDEREQTLNQLLVEMDGFEKNESVIIIAATNRADVLDPALLRPGRFDRQVMVPNPDIEGRTAILDVHLEKVPKAPDVDARVIARGTPGFSGADLANLVNEAALLAARREKKVVTMGELEEAKDKVMMGAERKTMVMDDAEKKCTAYHEAGHALVSLSLPASDPIHKATIIPRGGALGMVMRLPERDRYSYLRDKMYADLAVSMGGRVAEELIFGYDKVSSGASGDIEHATNLARSMVTKWGMSKAVGPLDYGRDNSEAYLGYKQSSGISEQTAQLINAEVKQLVEDAHVQATDILNKRIDDLHNIAKALLEYETLTGDEIQDITDGKPLNRPDPEARKNTTKVKSSLPSKKRQVAGEDVLENPDAPEES